MRPRPGQIVACASFAALVGAALWCASPVSADLRQAKAGKPGARVARRPADRASLTREQPGRRTPGGSDANEGNPSVLDAQADRLRSPDVQREPRRHQMHRAASFDGDLRALPQILSVRKRERPEREGPEITPLPFPGTTQTAGVPGEPAPVPDIVQALSAPARARLPSVR